MSMSKRKEKREAEEKKFKKVKQGRVADETRAIEEGENQDPALKRYLQSVMEREREKRAETEKQSTLMNQSGIRAKQKEAKEELDIERKRIEDEKFKKQMRQRR
jgi:hypothetical protein